MGTISPFPGPARVYSLGLMLFGVETIWNLALFLGRLLLAVLLLLGRGLNRLFGIILFGLNSANRRLTNLRRRRRRKWHANCRY